MFPIIVRVGSTEWKTKLMMKKSGDLFIAFNASSRKKEEIVVGKKVKLSFKLE